MTESEWLSCADPKPMLEHVRANGIASERKLRLFACACCRRIWHLLTDHRSRMAVELSEHFADDLASTEELSASHDEAQDAIEVRHADHADDAEFFAACAAHEAAYCQGTRGRAMDALIAADETSDMATYTGIDAVDSKAQADLHRDIFNPFRSRTIEPAWLTPPVVSLAQSIYDQRSFDLMPQLAELLEEAGCSDAGILGHCRSLAEHVRGCWVVDAVLGRA